MRRTGGLGFAAATLLLVMVAALSFVGTAICRAGSGREEQENLYREMEEQLIRDTREYLDLQGFPNSGVMLNRVVEADGSREYTLTVHHRTIDRMTEQERAELSAALTEFEFEDDVSRFWYEFLIND